MKTVTSFHPLKKTLLGLVPVLAITFLIAAVPEGPSQAGPATKGKLHHTGFIWLKEPGNREHQQRLIDAAHRFAREIPEVRGLSVGRSVPKGSPLVDTSFDICLTMYFDDQAAMERYNRHPVHEKAAREDFLPLAAKFVFYDFVSE